MTSIENDYLFLKTLYEKTILLHTTLINLLKSKDLIKNHFLATKGFLIKKYVLKNVNNEDIAEIKTKLQKFINTEPQIRELIISNKKKLKDMSSYFLDRKTAIFLDPDKLIMQFNNATYNARLAIVRLNELCELINSKKEQSPSLNIKLILSLEKMLNQVIILTSIIEQAQRYSEQIIDLLTPFDIPVSYGRAMGKKEFESVFNSKRLHGNKDLVPVFDCPKHIEEKIIKMNKDERKNFFKKIGVKDSSIILIFETRTKPINAKTPIPQTNGLNEYKFINGTSIEILKAA